MVSCDTSKMSPLSHSESIFVATSPGIVYDLVSDITRTGEWSPICTTCWWQNEAGPQEGAWFSGRNEADGRIWETESQVAVAQPGREFAWLVGGAFARWGYTMSPGDGGTLVTESWEFRPEGIAMFQERYGPDAQAQIDLRTAQARASIPATLAAIKRIAEST